MASMAIKRTLNLHKYSIKATEFISNWKYILPMIFSISGLIIGCIAGKGQGAAYEKITEYVSSVVLSITNEVILTGFLRYIILPTVFVAVTFFVGLSIYGGLLVNAIPLAYGYIVGIVSFFMYNNFTLKGLAYCVILIFPYAALSLLAIILSAKESICMSEYLLKSISKSKKYYDYSFSIYYKNYLKNYLFVIAAALLKAILDYLFLGIFAF